MLFYIAQVLSIVSCVLLTISCKQKTQKKMLLVQCTECIVTITGTLMLGGITGAIVVAVALLRNILTLVDKNTKITTIVLIIASILLSALKAKSIIDMLPAVASSAYAIALYKNNIKATKIGFAINASLWAIYKLTIGAYVFVAFNVVNVIICLYELHKMKGSNKE